MSAIVIRGDARALPLPDESVDLIVTSPPFYGLRSYTDNGQHYAAQIGSEDTPQAYLEALWECMAEWARVVKPDGSIFVELGDKYSDRGHGPNRGNGTGRGPQSTRLQQTRGPLEKSLLGLPWRFAIGCIDHLGLILRAEIIWSKPSALPESVRDRVRRSHEQLFHFVKSPRYYAAVDEIREPHVRGDMQGKVQRGHSRRVGHGNNGFGFTEDFVREYNPLGKLPGSVWDIPSAPLSVPPHLGVDHFAAFPPALIRPVILGWSPPGVCTACGQGRRPVTTSVRMLDDQPRDDLPAWADPNAPRRTPNGAGHWRFSTDRRLTGYACACPDTSAPTRPSIVVDPFGGTGTTALVASVHGRTGITVDYSADYCRLAQWRVSDPGERARALGVKKPPPVMPDQIGLFDLDGTDAA